MLLGGGRPTFPRAAATICNNTSQLASYYSAAPLPNRSAARPRPRQRLARSFHASRAAGLAVSADFEAALQTFREIHRHPIVPKKFEVPESGGDWPVETRGMALGGLVALYRRQWKSDKLTEEDLQALMELDFAFNANDWKWENRVQSGLTTYKELHGDMLVPQEFEVPWSPPWAVETWGMKLGDTVSNIREKGYFVSSNSTDERVVLLEGKPEWPEWRGDAKGEEGRERRYARKDALDRLEWLDKNGFVWDDLERRWEDAQSALTTYKELNGDMRVPKAFEVPSSGPWGEEVWGMRLGSIVSTIRSEGTYMHEDKPERRQWLDDNGFVWDARAK